MTPEVMLPELGHFALIISLAFAICLSIIPLVGLASNQQRLVGYAKPLTFGPTPRSLCHCGSTVVLAPVRQQPSGQSFYFERNSVSRDKTKSFNHHVA